MVRFAVATCGLRIIGRELETASMPVQVLPPRESRRGAKILSSMTTPSRCMSWWKSCITAAEVAVMLEL